MPESQLVDLTLVLVLGMAAQWLAWTLRLPSILLLLVFGFFAGPEWLDLIDPDAMFGDILMPLVAIAAALILFEGGLSLSFKQLGAQGPVVGRLVTVGVFVTWGLATAFGYLVCGIDLGISLLLGAILSVSGPTVVQPLLRHIRPRGATAPILHWEGILVDPIGAILAVVVFEGLVQSGLQSALGHAIFGILKTLVVGGAIGSVLALILIHMLRRYWVPDWLHNPVALAMVLAAFAGSNAIVEDSGLLAVTVMGVVLANRATVSVRHIVEFKENLRVLLLSGVFVVLAARLEMKDFATLDWKAGAFLVWLIVIVRPASAYVSTLGSKLTLKERLFLGWMFPRGIVAAAVASVFAMRLEGTPDAELLVPLTFLVIVGTVLVYGLTSGWAARRLGLSIPNPQGMMIVGAHPWAREIGTVLQKEGIHVLMVDTNRRNLTTARMQGLDTWYGSALAEYALEEIDFSDLGRLVALTPNDEVNTLTALHYVHEFGREKVYQLVPQGKGSARKEKTPSALHGRYLFGADADYGSVEARFDRGAKVKATRIKDQFTYRQFREQYGDRALVLFTVQNGQLRVATVDRPLKPTRGQVLIAVIEDPR